MSAYTDLVAARVSTREAAALTGVSRATAHRSATRAQGGQHVPVPDRLGPVNKLCLAEREQVLAVLHSEEFIDATPLQVYAKLLDQGTYLCSVSTMYRVLAANQEVKERRRTARHPTRVVPELVATGPGQVYTWDITKLPGPARGVYYDGYVMIDIYSRYIVGSHVHHTEAGVLATRHDEGNLRGARRPYRGARRPGQRNDIQERRHVVR